MSLTSWIILGTVASLIILGTIQLIVHRKRQQAIINQGMPHLNKMSEYMLSNEILLMKLGEIKEMIAKEVNSDYPDEEFIQNLTEHYLELNGEMQENNNLFMIYKNKLKFTGQDQQNEFLR